jgi:hypothetical protein
MANNLPGYSENRFFRWAALWNKNPWHSTVIPFLGHIKVAVTTSKLFKIRLAIQTRA